MENKIFEISDEDRYNLHCQEEPLNKVASSKRWFFYNLFTHKQKVPKIQVGERKIEEERIDSYYLVYVKVV